MPVLPPRERELLLLSALGFSTENIASEMDLAVADVKALKQSMRSHLHARNAAHAFILALVTGDITMDEVDAERQKRGIEPLGDKVIFFSDAC